MRFAETTYTDAQAAVRDMPPVPAELYMPAAAGIPAHTESDTA